MTTKQKIILIFAIVGSLTVAFILGRISMQNQEAETKNGDQIRIITSSELKENKQSELENTSIEIRASKQGTKYYFPWCTSTFNEENTIYFSSVEEAEQAGYEKATSCLLEPE